MRNTACAFTGHRPFKLPWGFEEDHPDCVRLKLMLSMEIESRIAAGCDTFLCGMSWGADIWCAEIVLNLRRAFPEKGIRLTAVLAHEEQHAGWTRGYQEQYYDILGQADKCVILNPRYAEGCFAQRNRYMVDRAGALIAVYSGGSGGAKSTIAYAQKRGLDIVIFDPVKLSREHVAGEQMLCLLK